MPRHPDHLNLRLEPGMRERIEAVARRERRTISNVVRIILEDGLNGWADDDRQAVGQ